MLLLSFISRLTDSGCMHLNAAVDRLVLNLTQTCSARVSDALSLSRFRVFVLARNNR